MPRPRPTVDQLNKKHKLKYLEIYARTNEKDTANRDKLLCLCKCWNYRIASQRKMYEWKVASCWDKRCSYTSARKWKEYLSYIWSKQVDSKHPLYYTRRWMISRCYDEDSTLYIKYWARWVSVDSRRLIFKNFIDDMWDKPSQDMTLDRIDTKWNYWPSNCRRATSEEQNCNQEESYLYKVEWELVTWSEAQRLLWIWRSTLSARSRNWKLERYKRY